MNSRAKSQVSLFSLLAILYVEGTSGFLSPLRHGCTHLPAGACFRRNQRWKKIAVTRRRSSSASTEPPTSEVQIEQVQQETTRNKLAQELIHAAKDAGQIGMNASDEQQELVARLAKDLSPYSDDNPARVLLTGTHDLIYSTAPGGSNGAIGPFVGRVTQRFVDDTMFQNIVQLGPLQIALLAERRVIRDDIVRVKFRETAVSLFGAEVAKKELTSGAGVWKQIFVGEVDCDDGERILLRVMETPSLFIIAQKLD